MRQSDESRLKFNESGLPFVTVKFAISLDGRMATKTGDSKWISSEPSRRLAHQLRSEHDAVIVGIGTVLADDPHLTVRLVEGRNPLRVIVDSRLRVPPNSRVLSDGDPQLTLIATTQQADAERVCQIRSLGAGVLILPGTSLPHGSSGPDCHEHFGVDLQELLKALGQSGIASVLVEGGAGIITSMLAERRVDRLVMAIAPKIIGRGVDAIGDLGIERLQDAITFSSIETSKLDQDLIFDGRVAPAARGADPD
jgi:riboflavin-specific deaminase-like protein